MLRKTLLVTVALIGLTACDLSPDFMLPDVVKPSAFKEDDSAQAATVEPASDGKWKRFDEKALIDEFAWWRMFNDTNLDALMERAMADNPNIDVAIARVKGARAVVDTRAADLYPAISVGVGPERQQASQSAVAASSGGAFAPVTKPYTLYTARGTITYELDLFGQTRARVKAAQADADAELNNYRASRLSLQAELAQTYYRVAALRAEQKILRDTVSSREKTVALTNEREKAGLVDNLVLSSQQADLANVRADAASVSQTLAVNEHALATLVGVPPSELTVVTTDLRAKPPIVPAGIPSSLLERRPDIKLAEKQIAAANERIGVARGGYFPDISLSAAFGFVSSDLNNLFDWSNRSWIVGPLAGTVLTQPIFEGGRLAAARAQTQADYELATANYRVSVLTAFREVEDQLSGIKNVTEQEKALNDGLEAATRGFKTANARFDAGYSSYLEQLDAKRTVLAAERANVQVRGEHYITTIQLVKALGGSWQAPVKPEPTAPAATEKAQETKPMPKVEEKKSEDKTTEPMVEPTAAKKVAEPEQLPPSELPPAEEEPAGAPGSSWWDDAVKAFESPF